jgi:hypothetical protein
MHHRQGSVQVSPVTFSGVLDATQPWHSWFLGKLEAKPEGENSDLSLPRNIASFNNPLQKKWQK